MIKGIIFDMDGVLVDNTPIHIQAFVEWCKRRNIVCPHEKLTNLFGMGNDDIMKMITGNPDLTATEIEQCSNEKEQVYREIFEPHVKPLAGLVAILDDFKQMGLKIAVGSSAMRKNVDFVLAKCDIAGFFDTIADGDMVEKAKPDPAIFLLAAKLMGLKAEECLVFEDSFAGIEAARRAGMKVVAVATTFTRDQHTDYDALIDDFTQITAQQAVSI